MHTRRLLPFFSLLLIGIGACSSDDDNSVEGDAAVDASRDGRADASASDATQSTTDAHPDTSSDATATTDAADGKAADVSSAADAHAEAALDAGADANGDAVADGSADAVADTHGDAVADGSVDALIDAKVDALVEADAGALADATGDAGLHGIEHVLLLSVDGMHQVDLEKFVAAHPTSNFAKLTQQGVQYTNAQVNSTDGTPTNPSDSFPGLLALVTGGSSRTTGGWYDVSYARDLFPDATCAGPAGTAVTYDESIERDHDLNSLWGSTTANFPTHDPSVVRSRIDPISLPYAKNGASCTPVFPHQFIRVNTIFEVAKAAGRHTAWSDKHLAYELVTGPSGNGVDDFFAPEINSNAHSLIADAAAGADYTTAPAYTEVYDDYKVQAIVNEIDGHWSDANLAGSPDAGADPGVPAIFGMNFQAVSVAQKNARTPNGGYLDATGTPGAELADALTHTDESIGKIVAELTAKGLLSKTLIILTAKHGQSPIDKALVHKVDGDVVASIIDAVAPLASHIEDDVGLYWLKDHNKAAAAVTALKSPTVDGGAFDPSIETIYTSASPTFVAMFGDPNSDPHTPDLVLKLKKGTIYTTSTKKLAEHGGFADDDSHVVLVVSNPGIKATTVGYAVRTKQVAPSALKALGLDPKALQAVVAESTETLYGLPF